MRFQNLPAANHARNPTRDFLRQTRCRRLRKSPFDGFGERLARVVGFLFFQFPNFDQSPLIFAEGNVRRVFVGGDDAVAGNGRPQNQIDRVNDGLNGTKRNIHRHVVPFFSGSFDLLFEKQAHAFEFFGNRALKAENRLFFIADGKDRPVLRFASRSGEKFVRQSFDDRPLVGAGVLRFVNQNVIDAAVQLEQNPRRGVRRFQQMFRRRDQIVVVHDAAFGFQRRVAVQNRRADFQQIR